METELPKFGSTFRIYISSNRQKFIGKQPIKNSFDDKDIKELYYRPFYSCGLGVLAFE